MVKLGAFVDPHFFETCSYCRMINFRSVSRSFSLLIGNSQAMIEELMVEPLYGNVSKPVDCCCQHRPAVNLKVLGKIRAATQETDAYWSLSDDHQKFPYCRCLTIRYALINST